jgi:hypothetical protein
MTGQTDKKTTKTSAQRSKDPQGLPRVVTWLGLVLGGVSEVRPPNHGVELAEVDELPRRSMITTLATRRWELRIVPGRPRCPLPPAASLGLVVSGLFWR